MFQDDLRLEKLIMATEVLRMFTPAEEVTVGSYNLKHSLERMLASLYGHIENADAIMAAALLNLQVRAEAGVQNAYIGVNAEEHWYEQKFNNTDVTGVPRAHDFRPPGFDAIQLVMAQLAEGATRTERTLVAPKNYERGDFYAWFMEYKSENSRVDNFVRGWRHGILESEDPIPRSSEELFASVERDREVSYESVELARAVAATWNALKNKSL